MNVILRLRHGGFLTEQQVLTAARFRRSPQTFKLSPTLFRVLHEVIVDDVSLETLERRRGWPARSAKAIISLLLSAIEECSGIWFPRSPEACGDDAAEYIEYLTGASVEWIAWAMDEYGLTRKRRK